MIGDCIDPDRSLVWLCGRDGCVERVGSEVVVQYFVQSAFAVWMVGCQSGRKVHLDKERWRRGHDVSVRSMCLVCCAEWLKIRQIGQKREPPLMMSRFMWAAAYRSHRA